MQLYALRALELVLLMASVGVWVAVTLMPARFAVVPEYLAAFDSVFVASLVAPTVVVGRRLWVRLGWGSTPIMFFLLSVAFLATLGPVERLLARRSSDPDEGLMYDSGWMCSTHVDRTLEGPNKVERIYVLQQYCVPDGPGSRIAYRQLGRGPFMEKLNEVPIGLVCLSSSRRAADEC